MTTIRFRQERRSPMFATLWYAYDGSKCLGYVRKVGDKWQGVADRSYEYTRKYATRKAAAQALANGELRPIFPTMTED